MTDQHFRRVYLGIERILRKHLEQLRYFIFVTEAKDPEWNGTLEKFSAVEPNIPFHGQRITPDDISAIYEVHFPFVEDKESKQAIGVRIFFGPESSPSGSAVKEIYDRKLTP